MSREYRAACRESIENHRRRNQRQRRPGRACTADEDSRQYEVYEELILNLGRLATQLCLKLLYPSFVIEYYIDHFIHMKTISHQKQYYQDKVEAWESKKGNEELL